MQLNWVKVFRWAGLLVAILSLALPAAVSVASVSRQAGPYRVEVATDPATIPVGPARLLIKVTDASGKPVEGATVTGLAQMPGMPMGERDETATPQPGQPGVYSAPARFAMAGAYNATVKITGPQGSATAVVPLNTGQNTGTFGAGAAPARGGMAILYWAAGILFVLFVLYRMRKTGQKVNARRILNIGTLVGIILLVVVFLAARWAVQKYTQPGHMSVIEAQAMDMSQMKPPVGAVPVAAMAATREPIQSTVTYTGSATGYVDDDVNPRVTGTVVWMGVYPGDHVRAGQVVARLDTSELGSRVKEQAANVNMAEHQTDIARLQAQQARNQAAQAQGGVQEALGDVANARGEMSAAQQDVSAAQQERVGAQADLETAQSAVGDAQAQVAAAQADVTYWTAQVHRSEALVKTGAISVQEYQQDRNQFEAAGARLRQAQSKLQQANSAVRSAQARVAKADAMIAGAQAKVRAAQAKVAASRAKAAQAQDMARAQAAAAAAAEHQILHSQAGVQQAQAQLNTASVVAGYTEIRADVDGVVTQRLISPGTLVQPGQAILRIAQVRPIRLQANVAEADLPSIRVGDPVTAHTMRAPGRTITARVTSVFPSADPVARTSVVEALYPNTDRRLVPGDYVSMDISTGQNRDALVVPASAIVYQPQATSPVLATAQSPAVWVIESGTPEKSIYTCTMHPQVKQEKPGKCPI